MNKSHFELARSLSYRGIELSGINCALVCVSGLVLSVFFGGFKSQKTRLKKLEALRRSIEHCHVFLLFTFQVKISDFGLSRATGSGSDYYKASQGGRWPVKW